MSLPEPSTFESSLVEVSGTFYFHDLRIHLRARRVNCGLNGESAIRSGPGGRGTVRGVAFAGNRVFRGFRDGSMIAYDAANGEQVWATKLTAA